MTNALCTYFLIGVAYWLAHLARYGEPERLRRDPLALRVRIRLVVALLAVVGWPAAVAVDLTRIRR